MRIKTHVPAWIAPILAVAAYVQHGAQPDAFLALVVVVALLLGYGVREAVMGELS